MVLVIPKNIIVYIASNVYVPLLNTEGRRYLMLFLMGDRGGGGLQSEYTTHLCAYVRKLCLNHLSYPFCLSITRD